MKESDERVKESDEGVKGGRYRDMLPPRHVEELRMIGWRK